MKIAFTGDISFTGSYLQRLNETGAPEWFDIELIEQFKKCDYVIGNIEGVITEMPFLKKSGYLLTNPPSCIQFLKNTGINIFSLANNHTMDCGVPGLKDTLEYTKSSEIQVIGAGMDIESASAPLILKSDETSVGILAITSEMVFPAGNQTPGVFTADHYRVIAQRLDELKVITQWRVLIVHTGEEFTLLPWPERRSNALDYVAMGADIVIHHHSHTVQGYEQIEHSLIFYSLGNLIFDCPVLDRFPGTRDSLVVTIDFTANKFEWGAFATECQRELGKVILVDPPCSFFDLGPIQIRPAWQAECSRFLWAIWSQKRPGTTGALRAIAGMLIRLKSHFHRNVYFNAFMHYVFKRK